MSFSGSPPPPPPPPPPPLPSSPPLTLSALPAIAPAVAEKGPEGAFLLELLIYNGAPFKDHWAYWLRSHNCPDTGVLLHATGDVRNGFTVEIKRSYDLRETNSAEPIRRPLLWIDPKHIDRAAMFNNGRSKIDHEPSCAFETSALKVDAPGKSLNAVNESTSGKKTMLRNCQTWIVESARQLVEDGIITADVADYLEWIKQ